MTAKKRLEKNIDHFSEQSIAQIEEISFNKEAWVDLKENIIQVIEDAEEDASEENEMELSDFDDSDVLNYIESEMQLDDHDIERLAQIVKKHKNPVMRVSRGNLLEDMKYECMVNNFHKKTLEEVQNFFGI